MDIVGSGILERQKREGGSSSSLFDKRNVTIRPMLQNPKHVSKRWV